jgi:enterobactin synthetase component D
MAPPFIDRLPDSYLSDLLLPKNYPGVLVACRYSLSHFHDALFQQLAIEQPPALSDAVPKRRAEFLAGRYVAQTALQSLGQQWRDVPKDRDGSPVWPSGISGSLSHNATHALCVVHPCCPANRESALVRWEGVGVDIETLIDPQVANSLRNQLTRHDELAALQAGLSQPLHALLTIIFSAKESLFKCLYPQVKCYFDFLDAQLISVDQQNSEFAIKLLRSLSADLPAGRVFYGRYCWMEGGVVTLIYATSHGCTDRHHRHIATSPAT